MNADIFAWSVADIPGVDPQVVEAIRHEVAKLLAVGFIREVEYSEWLSNVVMVKKSNGATYQRLVNKIFIEQIE
ncbi:Retrovirus-related Pol polyprotein from transposon 297 family [Gossypium australe]|uniref:Retrovirus-related Pol polyprotein from transposon 297 family n=1 Tax=Gossypium australe TaxID=47621 RepID=A0A5B6WUP7_9ROSI|nr:Retrovirus-related Pol polyprotein from transposon 297 family [Gossypium australe]